MKLTGALLVVGTVDVVTAADLLVDTNGTPVTFGIITNSSDISREQDETLTKGNSGGSIGSVSQDLRFTVDIEVEFQFTNAASLNKFKLSTDPDVTMGDIGDIVTLSTSFSNPLMRQALDSTPGNGSGLLGWEITAVSLGRTSEASQLVNYSIRRFDEGAFSGVWTIDDSGAVVEVEAP
jgi:hypothetical protein